MLALQAGVTLNYTTVLNIVFLVIMAGLGWRFLRTGGMAMLRMMDAPATTEAGSQHHDHHQHHEHQQ